MPNPPVPAQNPEEEEREAAAYEWRKFGRRVLYSVAAGALTAKGLDFDIPFYVAQELIKYGAYIGPSLAKYVGHGALEALKFNFQDAILPGAVGIVSLFLYWRYANKFVRKAAEGIIFLPFRVLWKVGKNIVPVIVVAGVAAVGGVVAAVSGYSHEVLIAVQKAYDLLSTGVSGLTWTIDHWNDVGPVMKGGIGAGFTYVSLKALDIFTDAAREVSRTLTNTVGQLTPWQKNALHVGGSLAVGVFMGFTGLPLPDMKMFLLPLIAGGAVLWGLENDFAGTLLRAGGSALRGGARIGLRLLQPAEAVLRALVETEQQTYGEAFRSLGRLIAGGIASTAAQAARNTAAFARQKPRNFVLMSSAAAVALLAYEKAPMVSAVVDALLAVKPSNVTLLRGAIPALAALTGIAVLRGLNGERVATFRKTANEITKRWLLGARLLPEPLRAALQTPNRDALPTPGQA